MRSTTHRESRVSRENGNPVPLVPRFHGDGAWIPAGVYPALRCGAGMTDYKDYVYTPKLSFEEFFD